MAKKKGRPAVDPAEALKQRSVGFTEAEWLDIQSAADFAGVTRSELVRQAAVKEARKVIKRAEKD